MPACASLCSSAAASMRTAFTLLLVFSCMTMSGLVKATNTLKSVDYEVFGRVQGVCFRMYTEDEARKLGLVGWVKNTRQGTVVGQVQGPEEKVSSIGADISISVAEVFGDERIPFLPHQFRVSRLPEAFQMFGGSPHHLGNISGSNREAQKAICPTQFKPVGFVMQPAHGRSKKK